MYKLKSIKSAVIILTLLTVPMVLLVPVQTSIVFAQPSPTQEQSEDIADTTNNETLVASQEGSDVI